MKKSIIKKVFDYWNKSNEKRAAILVFKLIKVLNELGRKEAQNGDASMITIFEFSHESSKGEFRIDIEGINPIRMNKEGEVIK